MITWIKARWEALKGFFSRPKIIEHAVVNFAVIENMEWNEKGGEIQILTASDTATDMIASLRDRRALVQGQKLELGETWKQDAKDGEALYLDWQSAMIELLKAILEK